MSKKDDEIRQETESEEAASVLTEQDEASADSGKKQKKAPKRDRTPEEERERALNSVKRRKKLKYGALATTITVVFVAIVIVVNAICILLDDRFNWNIDLTSSGKFQIDDQTIEYLNQLNRDIKITMLADESYFLDDSRMKIVSETMTRFKAESNGHITIEYVDPTANPEAISVYSENYDGELTRGDAVVTCGDLVRVIPFIDLIRTDKSVDYSTYSYVTSYTFVGEQSLISAIMGVTDLNPVKVAVIDKFNGAPIYDQYDQYNFVRILELLDKNNYEYVELDIATDELTADYDLAILCSPANDLTEAQIDKISNYLNNDNQYGKNLVYFGTPFKRGATPNLDAFLELWGISYGSAIVSDSNTATAQYVTLALGTISGVPVVNINGDASLNQNLTASKLPIIAPYCCPITTLYEQNSGRNTYPLLVTPDTSYLYPLDASAENFDPSKAETGAFNIAVLADMTFTSGSDILKSQIVAFGSAWFLDYAVAASAGSYANASYFISVLNDLTGKENVLTIAEKSLDTTQITITDSQAKTIRNVTVLIIPIAVALIGIVVYVRRRNK